MANRPVYIAKKNGSLSVFEKEVEFKWHPGMSITQKQKSIASLHASAEKIGITPMLEVSSKSEQELGVALSAFNLKIASTAHKKIPVECAFQGSKVFKRGGAYTDLFERSAREAKTDARLKDSGGLIGFRYFNDEFPLKPRTFFYDWLYINALIQNENLAADALSYVGFTDIEFNPSKSINCQAFSAALFVSLSFSSMLEEAVQSPRAFADVLADVYRKRNAVGH